MRSGLLAYEHSAAIPEDQMTTSPETLEAIAAASVHDTPPPSKDSRRALETKWGKSNIAAGWTCIPNILIRRQVTLGLTPTDLNILLHLLAYWWVDENHPHPSKETLAQAIGISASTVQRRIRSMEAGGLLRRIIRPKEKAKNDTNQYDLTPLKDLLEPHALLELSERDAGRAGRKKRMTSVTKVPPATNK